MKSILLMMFTTLMSLTYAQNHAPKAVNDSFLLKQDANVLDNDSDQDGDNISVLRYTVDGIQYSPLQGYNTKLKAKYGNVSLKSTGEVHSDSAIKIVYTISDGHRGTATANCIYYKPKPVIIRPPAAVNDIYIVFTSKLTKDTLFNVFANDTIFSLDSFKIIYFVSDGGAYPMSMSLGITKYTAPICSFWAIEGVPYNKGCIQARSNGILTWGPNLPQGKNIGVQVIEAAYIAQDKKGRFIGGSVTIIINL